MRNLLQKEKNRFLLFFIVCLGNILDAFSAKSLLFFQADLVCRWHDRNRADSAAHNRDPSFLSGARFQHYHAGACLYFPREKIYIICNFKLFYVSDRTGILQSDPWRLCSDKQDDPMRTALPTSNGIPFGMVIRCSSCPVA